MVRADVPIPRSSGVYYFEIRILSKGIDGSGADGARPRRLRANADPSKRPAARHRLMAVGLATHSAPHNRLLGTEPHMYGYHARDGRAWSCKRCAVADGCARAVGRAGSALTAGVPCGSGASYGPTYTAQDVVGCCVNWIDGTCFFTKNGRHLGVAFSTMRDESGPLYPAVGLCTTGESVEANFGRKPFEFDLASYLGTMRTQLLATIDSIPAELHLCMPALVMSYFVHCGYAESAAAFAASLALDTHPDLSSARVRQRTYA